MKHTQKPRVSVVIPTCNRPELLSRALRSVRTQTFQDFEVIVVDDGDKKFAEDILRVFNDSRIHYIKNDPPKRGGGATRNIGIMASMGEYIAFLDDDDEWLSEKLSMQVALLDGALGNVGFCVTAVENVTADRVWVNPLTVQGEGDFHEVALLRLKGFLTSALVVRREVFKTVGLFDEDFPSHQEAELMIRITSVYRGIALNIPLVRMDMRSDHDHISSSLDRRIRGRELLLAKHADKYAKRPDIHAKLLFWLGIWCRDNGDFEKAGTYFLAAFRADPSWRSAAHVLAVFWKRMIR